MKYLIAALPVALLTTLLLAVQKPDPPLPDAVSFCHMPTEGGTEMENCMCAKEDMGGTSCEEPRQDNGRPRFCRWMCGHAKHCGCCAT